MKPAGYASNAEPLDSIDVIAQAAASRHARRAHTNGSAGLNEDDVVWPERPDLPGGWDPTPLSLDALPPILRDHAASVAGAVQVSPDMTILLSLAAISAAVAGKVEVRVDAAWTREWVPFYGAIIAEPGERKSGAYGAMTGPLRQWEADAASAVAPKRKVAEELADVAERRLRRTKEQAAQGKASDLEVEAEVIAHTEAVRAIPVVPSLLAQDSTPEALVVQMAEQGGRVAVMSPEGGPLQILDGRYSDGAARLEELAQAYDGEELCSRRIGRQTRPVRRPALTLAVAIQPSVLATIRNGRSLRGQGIYGRICWVLPASLVGSRVDSSEAPPLDQGASKRYEAALRRLLDWQPTALDADGVPLPQVMTMSPEATARKREWHCEVEPAIGQGGKWAGISDWAGKLVGRAVRIAALLEMADQAGRNDPLVFGISGTSMQRAIDLCRGLVSHALTVYREMEMDGRTADLRYLMQKIQEIEAGSTESDLRAATRGRASIEGAEDLAGLLDELEERGCVRRLSQPHTGPGRPLSRVLMLHPHICPRSTTRNTGNTGNTDNSRGVDSGGAL